MLSWGKAIIVFVSLPPSGSPFIGFHSPWKAVVLNFISIASVNCLGLHFLVGVYGSRYFPRMVSLSKSQANKWQAFLFFFVQLSKELLHLIPPRASDRYPRRSCLSKGNFLTPEYKHEYQVMGMASPQLELGKTRSRNSAIWRLSFWFSYLLFPTGRPHSPHCRKMSMRVSWFYAFCSAPGERMSSSLWVLQSLWKLSDCSDLGQPPVPEPITHGMGVE